MSNAIVSAMLLFTFASRIAWRSDPAPPSLRFVTTKTDINTRRSRGSIGEAEIAPGNRWVVDWRSMSPPAWLNAGRLGSSQRRYREAPDTFATSREISPGSHSPDRNGGNFHDFACDSAPASRSRWEIFN